MKTRRSHAKPLNLIRDFYILTCIYILRDTLPSYLENSTMIIRPSGSCFSSSPGRLNLTSKGFRPVFIMIAEGITNYIWAPKAEFPTIFTIVAPAFLSERSRATYFCLSIVFTAWCYKLTDSWIFFVIQWKMYRVPRYRHKFGLHQMELFLFCFGVALERDKGGSYWY